MKVVVVHSHTGGKKMWDFLENSWQECGTVRLVLSHQRFATTHHHHHHHHHHQGPCRGSHHWVCVSNREFTLDTLTSANPDVIICSDPAGFVAASLRLFHTHQAL